VGHPWAGAEGFEPSGVLRPLVFKTSAFVRSAMPPRHVRWNYTIFGGIYLPGEMLVWSGGDVVVGSVVKRLREPISGLTHLAGAFLALIALGVLLARAAGEGRVDQFVAFGIFGCSLVALYGASALYHLLPVSPPAVARLRKLDHMAIFILIAGTYTPVCVLALKGGWGVGLLGAVWALAFCGVVLKLLWIGAPRWLSVGLYLAMGWVAVVAVSAILKAVPPGGIAWILAGGLVYSAGAVIYGLKWPNLVPGVFGFHELWHLFVLAGSACHFWAMLRYISLIT
jgi:hemolysin III